MDGALLIDKPAGITSFDVLKQVRRMFLDSGVLYKDLPKFGHGGTLDPFATGLLIVLIGEATKLSDMFLGSKKCYEGEIQFGAATLSGDIETEVSEKTKTPDSFEMIKSKAKLFSEKPYLQVPPMYSAKKVNGRRLYKLARKDRTVERDAVECVIENFEVFNYDESTSKFKVICSSGTYIRVLAEDLAKEAGSLGHLLSLRRLKSGDKKLEESVTLEVMKDKFKASTLFQSKAFIPLINFLPTSQHIELPEEYILKVVEGKHEPLKWLSFQVTEMAPYLSFIYEGRVIAIVESDEYRWKYKKVFVKLKDFSEGKLK